MTDSETQNSHRTLDNAAVTSVAALVGPGAVVPLAGVAVPPPTGWEVVMRIGGVQLVDDGVAAVPDTEAVRLTLADVPDMSSLVKRTKPGPFRSRTVHAIAHGIRGRGETPFLHAAAENVNAARPTRPMTGETRADLGCDPFPPQRPQLPRGPDQRA